MNTNPNITCGNCGRSFNIPETPACNYVDSCLSEYKYTRPACFKVKVPECETAAVIPTITVETTEGITNLANVLVHVTSNNTTYYVDDKHRIIIVWAGPVEADNYDIETNPSNLRSQDCYTTVDGEYAHIYFDKQGVAHVMSKEAPNVL